MNSTYNTTSAVAMDSPTHFQTPATAYVVPILAFLAIVLNIPAFFWHLKSKNFASALLIFWIVIGNVWNFINPIIWHTDNTNSWYKGAGLCDIEVKIQLAAMVGIPGALICIFRQLAIVLDTENMTVVPSRGQRRRRLMFDIFFCGFWPAYIMGIHIVVQPNRYYILTVAGCTPSADNSWPSLVLLYIWPLLLCIVGSVYAAIAAYRIRKYWRHMASILSSYESGFNKWRLIRLFALAMILILVLLPVSCVEFASNAQVPLTSYSWHRIHNWGKIPVVTTHGALNYDRWLQIAFAYLLFACFGFGKEATTMYRSWAATLGLAKWFARLPHLRIPSRSSSARSSFLTDRLGSVGSRARLLFSRKQSRATLSSLPGRETDVVTPSSSDADNTIEHTTPAYGIEMTVLRPKTSWSKVRLLVNGGNRTEIMPETLTSHIWSAPQTSPIPPGTIKVKKEVEQKKEREVLEV